MNTSKIAHKPGFHLTSSVDMGDVRPGLELVKAANLKQSTLLVVGPNKYQGTTFEGDVFGPVGTKLKFIRGEEYVECYKGVPVDDGVRRVADETIRRARDVKEITRDDVLHAARHYFASSCPLAEHGADGLTTVCLNLCGQVGTPCIGFMRLMDERVVAGCEGDIGSAMTMMRVHNLLGRPGFMADPLVDTPQNLFANAHCNCPTRLDGFDQPPAEYILQGASRGRALRVAPGPLAARPGVHARPIPTAGVVRGGSPRWSATTTALLGRSASRTPARLS